MVVKYMSVNNYFLIVAVYLRISIDVGIKMKRVMDKVSFLHPSRQDDIYRNLLTFD